MKLDEIDQMMIEAKAAADFAKELNINGTLKVRKQQGVCRYYLHEDSGDKYLGKNCVETIRKLEEKNYCAELFKTSEKEKTALAKIKKILEAMPDYRSVFLSLPPEKRHLIRPYEYAPKIDKDSICVFNRKSVPKELKLITKSGERVRSKSELIIADRLREAGVPYFYEEPLILAENIKEQKTLSKCFYWHPDFLVQNIRTGKQYYWEHFGMMDDSVYCASCLNKMEIYAHYGYFPGENLIITLESKEHVLNMEYVDCLINKYLK